MNRESEYPHIQRASENFKDVEEILNDTYRLLSWFHSIVRSSALHIYHSALSFTPPGTRLYQMYSRRFPNRIIPTQGVRQHWRGHSGSVYDLSFSPDGFRLASGSGDKTVRLWDGATGLPIATLEGHSNAVTSLSFSLDGSRFASGSDDSTVRLWEGATGVPIATLEGHSNLVTSLSFSPDGSRLASGLYDKTVRLWDGATGIPIATLEGHPYRVTSLSFSPDGSRLASGSGDKTLRLWDGSTGAPISTLEGHSDSVRSLSFSPDGSRLVSGSSEWKVRLWDGATAAPIATLESHSGSVRSLSFSPDGSWLASGSDDGTVRLWNCASEVSIAAVKGHFQSVYSISLSSLLSQSASIPSSTGTILRHRDGDTYGSFSTLNTKPGWSLSNKTLSVSLHESRDPSRHYYLQSTVINNSHVPLLWLPVDTDQILMDNKAAALGCMDGRVIISDLTQLNFQEIIIM